jgi:hypothetical protein
MTIALTDGKTAAYFRGRKLHGRAFAVPEGYKGVIALKQKAPKKPVPEPDEPIDVDAEEEILPLGSLEEVARFDKIVIWGHESVADAADDLYVRGVDEWIGLSEKVRKKLQIFTRKHGRINMRSRRFIHSKMGRDESRWSWWG